MFVLKLPDHPVVQWSVILKFQRTDRMGYPFNSVFNRVGKVVHGVNTPFVSCIMMFHMSYTVNDRIPHINIRGSHVNFRSEDFFAIPVFSFLHFFKKLKVFLNAPVAVGAFLSRFCQRSSVLPDFIRSQVADISFSFFDQFYSSFIHLIEIIGRKKHPVFPISSKPLYISFDGFHKFIFFFCRVCIIKAEIKFSMIFFCKSVI